MSESETRIRAWADTKGLPPAYVEKWLALDAPARSRLIEAAEQLKFRTGQFITFFALLEEIAVRERRSIAEILALPSLRRLLNSGGSGPGRARALIEEIRVLRYPVLTQTREKLVTAITALQLPPGIKVTLPRDLASDEVRIEIVVRGGRETKKLLAALTARTEGLARLAAMLVGADENGI
jgi:hypothetical protein